MVIVEPPAASARRRARASRRVWAAILGVALALAVPGLAQASFTGLGTASQTVGTYQIPAPASVTATATCTANKRTMTVNVSSYARVDKATSYVFTLTPSDGSPVTTQTIASTTNTLALTNTAARNATFTLSVQGQLGNWIGTALVQPYTCP